MHTERELRYCSDIAERVARARAFLVDTALVSSPPPLALFEFLSTLRQIQGNLSNGVSFAATLLAKEYLAARFGATFDAAEKPQGAAGIDIDVIGPDGSRIAGEIKTTVPYQANDFGAQQGASFRKDFVKLAAAQAQFKFLFVTDARAFAVLMKPKYLALLPGVRIVNLASGVEHAA